MENELKSCPFCGSNDTRKIDRDLPQSSDWKNDGALKYIECRKCGTRGKLSVTREAAVTAWNTRPDTDKKGQTK